MNPKPEDCLRRPAEDAVSGGPFVSVVVPVHDGGSHLGQCLDALLGGGGDGCEVLVVDDASTDGSAGVARSRNAKVLRLAARRGPAAARNLGAREARGDVLLFVDADVLVRPDTVARVAERLRAEPGLAAVFGSYDDAPSASGFVSQYKNLFHHFTHQRAHTRAETFWAGCGGVRREAFWRVGGFDEETYREPSIEDIELGSRLRRAGYSILLDKGLQVKHLKRWTLRSLLRADIFRRAVPWSRLMLERGRLTDDLNVRKSERARAALAVLALALLPTALFLPALLVPALLLLCAVVALNRELYGFFLRRRGVGFAVGACALHLFYYVYSSAAFAWCWAGHVWKKGRGPAPAKESDVRG